MFVGPDDLAVARVLQKTGARRRNGGQRTTGRPTTVIRHVLVGGTIMIAVTVVRVGFAVSGNLLRDGGS